MTDPAVAITNEMIDEWADNLRGPVALHLRQKLVAVEDVGQRSGSEGFPIIFPPTYAADESRAEAAYSIATLSDGTKVVQIDSVGSQANRMEPLYKRFPSGRGQNPLAKLVPQIDISVNLAKTNETKVLSIFDAGHRLGDALVRSSEKLGRMAEEAFADLQRGNAQSIAKLAPTSLVFGVWDSRGEGAKLPRIVQSVVRAWDVDVLRRSAQYSPQVDFSDLGVLSEEEKEEAEAAAKAGKKNPAAQRGYVHVPAVNTHGGVVVRGSIWRDVTVNLVALRQLDGEEGEKLRRYILGLAIVAATEPQDGFLRQGCLLTFDPNSRAQWFLIERTGHRSPIALSPDLALNYARAAADAFGCGPNLEVAFSVALARGDLEKAESEASKKKRKKASKDED